MALKREEATVEWLIDVLLTLHYADSHILWFGSKGSLQKERLFISPAVPVPYCSYACSYTEDGEISDCSFLDLSSSSFQGGWNFKRLSMQSLSIRSALQYVGNYICESSTSYSNDMGYLHTSRAETQLNTPCWLRQLTCSCYLACTVTSKHIKCATAHRSFLSAPQVAEARTNHESEVLCTCFIF